MEKERLLCNLQRMKSWINYNPNSPQRKTRIINHIDNDIITIQNSSMFNSNTINITPVLK